ncbi:DHCW motif cupin fold protein [Desulfomicrobium orale]|uniref:Cupin 2 conserved barrel domain-containing protein n=1 Tax=Desulfomicrobium orale DSM 12838 TaxID=888061 RepID=A0A0X8JQ50_9BACT|nr:DHCW motif cupin fold protein [Desulfomicrobium orale]AMD92880.1 hypothetical protein AXF15_07040 [Desulfomicrobium orale DSM 12838]
MRISDISFGTTDWSTIEAVEHKGEQGSSFWKTIRFGDISVSMAEYAPGYRAADWCDKGHILLCLEGELRTELKDGRVFVLKPGMTYQVADNETPHRSSTKSGAKIFIVD